MGGGGVALLLVVVVLACVVSIVVLPGECDRSHYAWRRANIYKAYSVRERAGVLVGPVKMYAYK